MKKVSFDFDDTLSFESVQDYAKKLIAEGVEVHITTSRYENISDYPKDFLENWEKTYGKKATTNDLFDIATELGIPKERIHFTNMQYKSEFLTDQNFVWHLDDNDKEIFLIQRSNIKTKGIYLLGSDYDYKCNELLGLTHLNN